MKSFLTIFCLLAALFAGAESCSASTDSVGIIKTVSGEVFLVSTQKSLSAAPNMKINRGDTIKTGATGSVGLIFDDDTVVSLGPNSEIAVESFMFNPVDQELSFVSRLIKGTFCFVTGQIAKLAPKKVKFETPEATLGVRGTKFLVEID
ncbi:MAG: FecR domain-containing protein [Proteobacteria bacterium]|nr:FecR domain-containing protein [Pseudomonadota bacterium]